MTTWARVPLQHEGLNRRGAAGFTAASQRTAGLSSSALQASRAGSYVSAGANGSYTGNAMIRGGEHPVGGDREYDRDQGVRGGAPRPDSLLRHRSDTTHDGRRSLFPELASQSRQAADERGIDSRSDALARRPRGQSGTPPAYPLVAPQHPGHPQFPSAPPLQSYLGHGAGNSGSAGSRSVPPGRGNRPPTPTGPGALRRGTEEPSGAGRLGVGQLAVLEGRDSLPGRAVPEAASRSRSVAASGAAGGSASSTSSPTCDKCDGKHSTDQCPHYRGDREKHKDAWVNYGRKGGPLQMGNSGGNFVLKSARVIRQPGDGSCLFHSLAHGLPPPSSASGLRREIAGFVRENPEIKIAGDTLEEWVRWDSSSSVSDYARRMAVSGWGGGIEMAACSLLKNVNVHVYENGCRRGANSEFKRISCFDAPNPTRTVHVLYQGGVHYDALVPLAASC